MTIVEREELQKAMEGIDKRFERIESSVDGIQKDLASIKGMAKFVTVALTIGIPTTIALATSFFK